MTKLSHELSSKREHLQNFFVFLNIQAVKFFKASSPGNVQKLDELENTRSHLHKIPFKPKMLENFLKEGDSNLMMESVNEFFLPRTPSQPQTYSEEETQLLLSS